MFNVTAANHVKTTLPWADSLLMDNNGNNVKDAIITVDNAD
jgi:hypothetical protein